MRRGIAIAVAASLAGVLAAVALGSSTTYTGSALTDTEATIELKITDADERRVKQVIVKGIQYSGGSCTSSGRTPKAKLKGYFRVKGNGEFRAVGGAETNDPLTDGQLNVIGDATKNKVTGDMKFTFGKDGCESNHETFKATK
ncbi:MAG: hypothetical protein QOI31_2785 [Solirubrobacterales bacterium]|nr:hypothetical protein [Solirubrobacterales bacterium]